MYTINQSDTKEKINKKNISDINNTLFLMPIAHSSYQVIKDNDIDTPQYFGVSTLTDTYNHGYKDRLFVLPKKTTYISTVSTPGLWGMLSEYDKDKSSLDSKFLPNIGKTTPFIGDNEDSIKQYHKYKSKLRYTKQKSNDIQDLYNIICSNYESKQGIKITSFNTLESRIDKKINNLTALYAEEGGNIIEKTIHFNGECLSFNGLGMLSQGVNAPENKQLINQGRYGLYGVDKFYMTSILLACNYIKGNGISESRTYKFKLSPSLKLACRYIIDNKNKYYESIRHIDSISNEILKIIVDKIINISYKLLSNFDNINIWLDSFGSIYLSEVIYTITIDSQNQNIQQHIVIISSSCSSLEINETYKTNQITRRYPSGEHINVYSCESVRTTYNVNKIYRDAFEYIERFNLISSGKFWLNNLKKKIIYMEKHNNNDNKLYSDLLNLYDLLKNNDNYYLITLHDLSRLVRNYVVPSNNINVKSYVSYWDVNMRNEFNSLGMCYKNNLWMLCQPSTLRILSNETKIKNLLDNEWKIVRIKK